MQPATLGGVRGAGEVWSRRPAEGQAEWRGTFGFKEADEEAMVALEAARTLIAYEGLFDGERRRIEVRVTAVMRGLGLAFFEGTGEPS
jgi:hypothetical protein